MPNDESVVDMIPRDAANDSAAILRQAIEGKSAQEIATQRGLTLAEVNRALDVEAARMLGGEGTRRAIAAEAGRLDRLKQRLYETYMQTGDTNSASLYVKASERLASMLGWNHPAGHVVSVIGNLQEPQDNKTNTQRMLEAVRALKAEYPLKPG